MAEGHGHNPLDHVMDQVFLDLPIGKLYLPTVAGQQMTRFMVMELIAATLIVLIVVPLARHVAKTRVSRGPFFNAFEAILLFIRDSVARPSIAGGHAEDHGHGHGHGHAHGVVPKNPADVYVPFLWTMFFFILFNNLLGMFPGGASATGNINVTGVLAVLTLGTVVVAGMRASGPVGFFVNIVPPLDVPMLMKPPLWALMFVIEISGLLIRHIVLAVRLFANMLAGHIVLAVILGFAIQASGFFRYIVAPASVLGVVALSLLELLVAFLQAYIFTFLAALFIGSAAHPH